MAAVMYCKGNAGVAEQSAQKRDEAIDMQSVGSDMAPAIGAIDMKGNEYRIWSVEVPRSMKAPDRAKEIWIIDEASLAGQRETTKIMEMAQTRAVEIVPDHGNHAKTAHSQAWQQDTGVMHEAFATG